MRRAPAGGIRCAADDACDVSTVVTSRVTWPRNAHGRHYPNAATTARYEGAKKLVLTFKNFIDGFNELPDLEVLNYSETVRPTKRCKKTVYYMNSVM